MGGAGDIIEFFSRFSSLPIRIDDVRDHALELGGVDEIRFHRTPMDSAVVQGVHRMYEEMLNGEHKRVAEIIYSSDLSKERSRIVCCKEILHIFDDDRHTAQSMEVVNSLVEQIIVPFSTGIYGASSNSASSDRLGDYFALLVLLPRDALHEIRPRYEATKLSVEDVARLAQIPVGFARLALSDTWREVTEEIV